MSDSHEMVGAIYEIESQAQAGHFTVPEAVCGCIGVDKGSEVDVIVESATGRFGPVRKTLKSDRQPSPAGEMATWMAPGERIRVTVIRPHATPVIATTTK